jgi:hypothetical protein
VIRRILLNRENLTGYGAVFRGEELSTEVFYDLHLQSWADLQDMLLDGMESAQRIMCIGTVTLEERIFKLSEGEVGNLYLEDGRRLEIVTKGNPVSDTYYVVGAEPGGRDTSN